MTVLFPQTIAATSWLHEDRFRWFLPGYRYASTQTHAISGLSCVPPETTYHVFTAILRGLWRDGGPEIMLEALHRAGVAVSLLESPAFEVLPPSPYLEMSPPSPYQLETY